MKRTYTINISGQIFTIDDDAYDKLNWYLATLASHFGSNEEGKEIVSDIESRLSELFKENVEGAKQVVTIDDVEKAISILGKPEEIFEESAKDKPEEKQEVKPDDTTARKRIYRDPENRLIGGVCSGIAEYFNIDPVIVRILFVIAFFAWGSGVLLYLVLWFIVPQAVTTAQKLEMRGEPITVSNIQKSIKDEYEQIKTNVKRGKPNDFISRLGDLLGQIVQLFAKAFSIIFGVIFLIGGIAGTIAFISAIFFTSIHLQGFGLLFFGNLIPFTINLFVLGISLVAVIPMLLLAYVGARLLFNFKGSHKLLGISALAAWILGLSIIIFVSIAKLKNFRSEGSASQKIELKQMVSDTCTIDLLDQNLDTENTFNFGDNRHFVIDNNRVYGKIRLNIKPTDDENFILNIKKETRWKNHDEAKNYADSIQIKYIASESQLFLPKYFEIPGSQGYKNQKVSINLYVPKGKVIRFKQDLSQVIYNANNNTYIDDEDVAGHTWTMGEEELIKLN